MGMGSHHSEREEDRLHRAAHKLATLEPLLSARGGAPLSQRISIVLCLSALTFLAWYSQATLFWIIYTGFCALIFWRTILVAIKLLFVRTRENDLLPDDVLPTYSVLVPLFDEAQSVAGLTASLNAMDYPVEKLDIHFLLEEIDDLTAAALTRIALPDHFHIHVLGDGIPRTKPRALNYGLELCDGAYVTIYDAEDRPHPDQLRTAATAFAQADTPLACLQAPLQAHNETENWIAAQWALEYAIQFRLLVPAMARAGFPIPLGGTSNHFDKSALEHAGGWDAWNVTEDADLGLRFARLGMRIGSITPPTKEEAPVSLRVWTNQRSRWIKGFMQSWLVLMRRPVSVLREMGIRNWIAMQLTLGGAIFAALLAGPMAIFAGYRLLLPGQGLGEAGIALFLLGYGINALAAIVATNRWSFQRIFSVATLPLYWPLLSIAAVRALYGLARTPHFWAKTPHGQSRLNRDEDARPCPILTGSSPSQPSPASPRWQYSQIGKQHGRGTI